MIVLGIDPGTERVGYGVVRKRGGELRFVSAGILKVTKKNSEKLLEIKNGVSGLVNKFAPDALAVEKLYFSKNQKTAMAVAEARGVIMLAALENGLKIYEYSPNEVKSGVAGYGFADKKAIFKMVRLILREPSLKAIDDASDALAIAIFGASNIHT